MRRIKKGIRGDSSKFSLRVSPEYGILLLNREWRVFGFQVDGISCGGEAMKILHPAIRIAFSSAQEREHRHEAFFHVQLVISRVGG